jgi:hypothetical protein
MITASISIITGNDCDIGDGGGVGHGKEGSQKGEGKKW